MASPWPYPGRLADPSHDATHQIRRVKARGQIQWQGEYVFISEAVHGELIGLAEAERGDWVVRFMDVELGGGRIAKRAANGGVARPAARLIPVRRRCGNATPVEIRERFPQELENLAQNARFPHSRKRIFFWVIDHEEGSEM